MPCFIWCSPKYNLVSVLVTLILLLLFIMVYNRGGQRTARGLKMTDQKHYLNLKGIWSASKSDGILNIFKVYMKFKYSAN